MPVRLAVARTPNPGLRIYRGLRYGKLAEFTLLDDRQYRTDNPCGDGEALRCETALTGDYTMLGRRQEKWLAQRFEESAARWNIVAQQLLIAQFEHKTIQPNWFWNDAWDGYPLARERLLETVVATKLRDPVFSPAIGILLSSTIGSLTSRTRTQRPLQPSSSPLPSLPAVTVRPTVHTMRR